MAKEIPIVSQAILDVPRSTGSSILLDTPEWFLWLEAPTTIRFSYALHNRAQGYTDGFMTVRKEKRQRGGAYWSVHCRRGHQLRKVYVGGNPMGAAASTHNRLEKIAFRLRDPPTT